MSYLFPNYSRKSIELIKGKDNLLFDQNGKEYLDFTSGIGVMNLGYNDAELNQILAEQAAKIWHTPNLYTNQLQEKLAQKLANNQEYVAFFCNSGTEANEAAIKLARKATGKSKIITCINSFHGRTYGAMSATGQESIHQGFEPLVPDFVYVPFNELAPLTQVLDDKTAAVMLELVQGEGGVLPAEQAWVQKVAGLCKEQGILLIIDEIQTGIGRTGSFYAYEQYQIEPDIVTLAKALGNGLPVGAMLGKKALAQAFAPGSHGSTFGGNKLAMQVAENVVTRINTKEFLQQVQQKGTLLLNGLNQIAAQSTQVQDVRGIGLMLGIELSSSELLTEVMTQLEAAGLLTLRAGSKVLRLLPPLTIKEAEIEQALQLFSAVLTKEG
ncbi:acetylornithine transaminase [Enterococcus sp. UD-01]|jgi:acetylornithine/N-succinyldiaminopimelate aminotransferase|uniref:acetylornithine transaminase n=1 Tax=Enterococcus sp. UD-01 TaxID=3373911 RepID=UPI003835F96C